MYICRYHVNNIQIRHAEKTINTDYVANHLHNPDDDMQMTYVPADDVQMTYMPADDVRMMYPAVDDVRMMCR